MQKSFGHGEIFHPKDEKPDQNTLGCQNTHSLGQLNDVGTTYR
jgi:hypothetical protein